MKKITWNIIYKNTPVIERKCPKCDTKENFKSSNCFRVNTNKNNVDVWLIYNCTNCKTSWNMDILSRVNPKSIDKKLYEKFLKNDINLAKEYSFNLNIAKQNKAALNYTNLEYEIIGEDIEIDKINQNIELIIKSEFPIDIRLDKILCKKLRKTRTEIEQLCKEDIIQNRNYKKITKHKLNKEASLFIVKRK